MTKINHLIIVGGLPGSGKSRLISKIKDGEYPLLCEQLGIVDPSLCVYATAANLDKLRQLNFNVLVVHYDIYRQSLQENGFNYLNKIIGDSNTVTVLTLCVSTEVLTHRNAKRIEESSDASLSNDEAERREQLWQRELWEEQRKYFLDESGVFALYSKWFNCFLECRVTNHLVFDSSQLNSNKAKALNQEIIQTFSGVTECDS